MKYFLSNSGIKIPNMIYGTAWKKDATSKLVEQALKEGFRGVDTAGQPKHYREDLVGNGLLKAFDSGLKKEDIYIQTKFTPIDGQDRSNMPYSQNDSIQTQIEKSFSISKQNLKLEYIDSYILHSPIFPGSKLLKAWDVMSNFCKNKEVGQLGISNCYDLDVLKYLYEKVEIKPNILQNRFFAQTSYDKDIRQWCKQKGIIYQSFWSLTANPHILANEILINFSKKYNKSEALIFYRYLNQKGIIPLNGTTSEKHMKEDLEISDFILEDYEIEQIDALLK